MAHISGLTGLRPSPEAAPTLACPPYDVIKKGSSLEKVLGSRPDSFYHIILGENPAGALKNFKEAGNLIPETEPHFYIYEQKWPGGSRTGVFAAVAVDDYENGNIVRHEKTFDDKVQGRIALARATGFTLGPIFLLTDSDISGLMESAKAGSTPDYDFTSDFEGHGELHGIQNKIWRIPANSHQGIEFQQAVAQNPLYIADGHHRYHAALKNNQTHTMAYITGEAKIQAYNRVIRGKIPFDSIKDKLELIPTDSFHTPEKNSFCLYSKNSSPTILRAKSVPDDVVGRLDCSILERELYPKLNITHDMILNPKHFDYYSETELSTMAEAVNEGKYDVAVALHPVSIRELMDVANAGLMDPDVVMPEKSTFFAPKILSGLFLYQHSYSKITQET